MRRLDLERTTRLVAGALGILPDALAGSFRPAGEADLEGILRLRAGHGRTEHRRDDRGYLRWRYDLSPEGRDNRLWLIVLDGEPVGTLGTERQDLAHGGREWEVHRLMDILVREDLMGSGLGAWMNLFLQEEFENTLCIGSTEFSHSIVTRLNRPLPPWQTWRYPIRLSEWKGHSSGLGMVNLALRGRRALRALGAAIQGASLESDDVPDPELTSLQASMAEHLLVPVRSAGKWRWRFDAKPGSHPTYHKLKAGGRLLAHAVTAPSGPGRAEILDLLFLHEGEPEAARALLAGLAFRVVQWLAGQGVDVASTRANDDLTREALGSAGFIFRDEPCAMGYHFRDAELAGLIERGVPLFLMPADADFD